MQLTTRQPTDDSGILSLVAFYNFYGWQIHSLAGEVPRAAYGHFTLSA